MEDNKTDGLASAMSLMGEIDELKRQKELATETIESKTKHIERLLDQNVELRDKVKSLNHDLSKMITEIDDLKDELDETKEELNSAEKALAEFRCRYNDILDAYNQCVTVEYMNIEIEKALDEAKENISLREIIKLDCAEPKFLVAMVSMLGVFGISFTTERYPLPAFLIIAFIAVIFIAGKSFVNAVEAQQVPMDRELINTLREIKHAIRKENKDGDSK